MIQGYPIGRAVEQAADGTERYAVWPLDLPGCIAQGASMSEAESRLGDILPAYKAALDKRGIPIPPPKPPPSLILMRATFAAPPGAIADLDLWENH